jgi:hypothetical protein
MGGIYFKLWAEYLPRFSTAILKLFSKLNCVFGFMEKDGSTLAL